MLRELTVVGLDRLGADDAGDRYNLAVEFHGALCQWQPLALIPGFSGAAEP